MNSLEQLTVEVRQRAEAAYEASKLAHERMTAEARVDDYAVEATHNFWRLSGQHEAWISALHLLEAALDPE